MKNNQNTKTTGLTVFENVLEEKFQVSAKHQSLPKTGPATQGDYFSICLTNKRDSLKTYFCELRGHHIYVKRSPEKEETAFMNIEWTRIKQILDDTVDKQSVHCLKFIKLRSYEEQFTPDYDQALRWFEALKSVCVLSRFREFFTSIKLLGKGNFARVFMVQRKTDKEKYAVKIFDKTQIQSSELEKKCLLYEINMMRLCDHPNLLKLYEIYEGENYIYCVGGLYNGNHLLNKLVSVGHFSENRSIILINQLLQALQYLEKLDVIHRDIKPENIIFKTEEKESEIVLVDLGFATYCNDYNTLFTRCGTPGYVAPEILNDKKYNCKADVFSAGAIFYVMLTGSVPFSSKTYEGLVEANMTCKINFNFNPEKFKISEEAMILLQDMQLADPKKRPSASDCLNYPIFSGLQDPESPMKKRSTFKWENVGKDFEIKTSNLQPTNMPDDMNELMSPGGSPMLKKKNFKQFDDFNINLIEVEED